MNTALIKIRETSRAEWVIYFTIYLPAGFFMNQVGIWFNIAKFTHWWQVLTCYGLYMVPISVLIKDKNFKQQYLHGLFAMCLLEFFGYALGTSQALGILQQDGVVIIQNNILAKFLDIKNFSLSMAIFFALYFPLGNCLVQRLLKRTGAIRA